MEPFKPEVVLKQVSDLGNLVLSEFARIDQAVVRVLPSTILKSMHEIYAVGDGDSYHAALAAEMAFGEFAKVAFHPMGAMHFLEYGADYINPRYPGTNMVIGISASGGSIRVVQALERAKAQNKDLLVAGLVGNPNSKVADAANTFISTQIPNLGASPGIRTFAASFMGLIALAIRIGEAKGRLSEENVASLHEEILAISEVIEQTVETCTPLAREAATEFVNSKFISCVGSGPSYGMAVFSGAKIIETAGIFAVGQDLEEWAHVEGLAYPLEYPVFMIAPPGKGLWRAEKLANYVTMLQHPLMAVSANTDKSISANAKYHFPVCGEVREVFSPLVTHIAADLLACFLAEEAGRLPFMLDNDEARMKSEQVSQSIKTKESGEI